MSFDYNLSKDEDLWDQAVKLDDRQKVDFSREAKREALLDIFVVAEKEKTSMKGRRWKLGKRSDGEPIVLRDVLGRIAGWIDSYKDVVINTVNYDPSMWLFHGLLYTIRSIENSLRGRQCLRKAIQVR